MRTLALAAALFGLTALSAPAQDAVTIKIAKLVAGDRVKVTKNEKMTSKIDFTAGGNSNTKDDVEAKSIVYTDVVITANDGVGKPLKLKRTYEKYELTKGGKAADGPPLNAAILIEKKNGKYTATAEQPLDPIFSAKLTAEFDRDGGMGIDRLLPGKPVKAGDTWKVDVSKLPGISGDGLTIDAEKSELTGKLLKTFEKGGKQLGELEYTGTIALKSLGAKSPVKLKDGSLMKLKMTGEACIDGTDPSNRMTGTLTIKMEGEGGGVTLSLTADGTIASSEELLPKK
ncbi:hypothetical protein [Gemmata sp.]|uniref:hypothetical protein n=1 Tax=Gemmata sp. TaxID=1914242 RepID=UPI003F712EFD